MRVLFPLLLLALMLAGCRGPCRQLADRLCECLPSSLDRDRCYQDITVQESGVSVDGEDDAVCAGLLEQCSCETANTPEGKERCGLARQ